ncbi:MAG: hypothetical protein R3A80_12950 [Bdellovibrionota bacterium]
MTVFRSPYLKVSLPLGLFFLLMEVSYADRSDIAKKNSCLSALGSSRAEVLVRDFPPVTQPAALRSAILKTLKDAQAELAAEMKEAYPSDSSVGNKELRADLDSRFREAVNFLRFRDKNKKFDKFHPENPNSKNFSIPELFKSSRDRLAEEPGYLADIYNNQRNSWISQLSFLEVEMGDVVDVPKLLEGMNRSLILESYAKMYGFDIITLFGVKAGPNGEDIPAGNFEYSNMVNPK